LKRTLYLPDENGRSVAYKPLGQPLALPATRSFKTRVAYAAVHVVADPIGAKNRQRDAIDWDATMAFRRYLWSLGFKIAEAMDTAQRGMGLDWTQAKELITRSIGEACTSPDADLASGIGTDHLAPREARSIEDVVAAYEEQLEFVETKGGRSIVMASRALARLARSFEEYEQVYDRLLRQARDKVILHWLGDMFDPELKGYWGSSSIAEAMDVVVRIIHEHRDKVDGIKLSLLDANHEIALRRLLPEGVRMYTGDDFNYPQLIAGDELGYSDALLGIFDPIAPAAALALHRLDQGDKQGFHEILDPTVRLARRIFEAPTSNYKSGIVFLAWLNGFQDHFVMLGSQQSARSIVHYADLFRLADQCGLLRDPELAMFRMKQLLKEHMDGKPFILR
jgi:hypothetical protein